MKHVHRILFLGKLVLVIILGFVIIKVIESSPGEFDSDLSVGARLSQVDRKANESMHLRTLSLDDYSQIIKKDPFGTSGNMTSSKKTSTNDSLSFDNSFSQESGLTLMGTISGSRSIARAIIKSRNNNVLDSYKTGQFIGDARIDSIEDDAVILFHNGQRKILPLTSWTSASGTGIMNIASAAKDHDKIDAVKKQVSKKKPDSDSKGKVTSMRDVLAKTTIKPYIVEGQKEGLEITGLENMKFTKMIGLREGDVISAVNGQRVNSKRKAYQIFKKARHKKSVSLDLIRDSKPKNISFPLR